MKHKDDNEEGEKQNMEEQFTHISYYLALKMVFKYNLTFFFYNINLVLGCALRISFDYKSEESGSLAC